MPDSTISSALDTARSTTTPMTAGWPASTGVAPDQPALDHLNPVSPQQRPRVMDVRRTAGQTIAQQAAAELAAAGQRAAAHPTHAPTQPSAHAPARHSSETMPEASNPQSSRAAGDLQAKANTEPAIAEWTTGRPAVEPQARHIAAETSASRPTEEARAGTAAWSGVVAESVAGPVGGALEGGLTREVGGTSAANVVRGAGVGDLAGEAPWRIGIWWRRVAGRIGRLRGGEA
jgi:hypothetical protein